MNIVVEFACYVLLLKSCAAVQDIFFVSDSFSSSNLFKSLNPKDYVIIVKRFLFHHSIETFFYSCSVQT